MGGLLQILLALFKVPLKKTSKFRTGDFVLGSAQISHDQGSILTMSSRDIHVLPPIFRGNTFPLLDIARLKSAQMMMEQEVDRCGVEGPPF